MEEAWGPFVVPQVEAIDGRNHFTVVEALAERGHRLHALALELLGLPV